LLQQLLEKRYAKTFFLHQHHLFLENITTKQQQKIKSFIVNANNYLNGIFSSFNFLNHKFFFIINNLLCRVQGQTVVATFVTTYIQTEATCK